MGNSCFLWKKGKTPEDNLERKNCVVAGLQHTPERYLGREEKRGYGMRSLDTGFVFCASLFWLLLHMISASTQQKPREHKQQQTLGSVYQG